jgi:serine/threonine protein kinase
VSESPHSTEAIYNSFTALSEEDVGMQRVKLGDYLRGSLLGQGSFGAVYEAYDSKRSKTVALKVCSSAKKKSIDSMKIHAVDQVEQEIRILSALPPSPFVVEYLANVQLREEHTIAIAYGLIRGENLHGLVERAGPLALEQVRHVVWSLLQAMQHLKANGVVHGDIKPENVIVSTNMSARLSDFGCACRIEECSSQRFKDIASVSPAFQSPEFASGHEDEIAAGDDLEEADWFSLEVWALGIVSYFAAVGHYPFSMSEGLLTLMDRISNLEFNKLQIEDLQLRDLVSSQLARASERANLQQCLQHPFCGSYTGELPAAQAGWKVPLAPKISFVDGVHPSMYEMKQRGSLSRSKSPSSLSSSSGSNGNMATSKKNSNSNIFSANTMYGCTSNSGASGEDIDNQMTRNQVELVRRQRVSCTIL